jgi:DNA-directed RNA polymerase subunit K
MDYTRFEKARIIGARALQLAYGAPPLVKVPEKITDPLSLAELEFSEGVIPIVVIREREKAA